MDITVDGRGTFTLSLASGGLTISLDGQIFLRTKGNPTKLGNPAFASIDEANTYFQSLTIAQPVAELNDEPEGEA